MGSLAASCKKVICGTGTLFGGRSDDVYYLLWRLFPHLMVKEGFQFSEVMKWNEHYGNIETTVYNQDNSSEQSNKQSRGGKNQVTKKVKPGISSFVYGKFLVQNSVLVRLKDVWPDPVELVNVPTILVDMDSEMSKRYREMESTFLNAIQSREDGYKLYLPLTDTGISFPDNMYSFPPVTIKNGEGDRDLIWMPDYMDPVGYLSPKEMKLQEIIKGEIEEGRNSIVYVRDTGSSNEGRDIRPRLKDVLEQIGAKVAILDVNTTATNRRSEWLRKKVEGEGYNVIIVSQELVKVGLDLLCTPSLIYYQFSWSLFTLNQSARRSWRIGQTEECRNYYLAYRHTYQEAMAVLIAQKNKAAEALNGDASSDGLNAMLGGEEDLQAMLIKSVKNGKALSGSTEEWTAASSDRAREILAGIGKKKQKKNPTIAEQLIAWATSHFVDQTSLNVLKQQSERAANRIQQGSVSGFKVGLNGLEVDMILAFGFDFAPDSLVLEHLLETEPKQARPVMPTIKIVTVTSTGGKGKQKVCNGQLGFDLFGEAM